MTGFTDEGLLPVAGKHISSEWLDPFVLRNESVQLYTICVWIRLTAAARALIFKGKSVFFAGEYPWHSVCQYICVTMTENKGR